MARTTTWLTASEILAIEELDTVTNNKVYYKDNSGVIRWVALWASGTVLTSAGATSTPTFSANGTGDFSWPWSSTDNAILRFDGTTGKLGQNSLVTVSDTGAISAPVDASVNSVIIGRGAGNVATNTAVGTDSLGVNTIGARNTWLGNGALFSNTSGSDNTMVGYASDAGNNTWSNNTGIWSTALQLSAGSNNTGIGAGCGGFNLSAGSGNTFVGQGTDASLDPTNSTALGQGATITASNQMMFGNSSVTTNVFHGALNATGAITGSNLSGTNTGDQTSIVGITGTKAQFNTACTDGDFMYLDSADTITGVKTFSTAPVFNALPTGSAVASTSTASTLVARDASKNIFGNNIVWDYTTTATAAGTTTLTVASTYQQFFTGVTTQTVVLPVTSTLTLGHTFAIKNNSTGLVTVNSSGSNAVIVIAGGAYAEVTCILASWTTAASWNATYNGIVMTSGKALTVSNSLTLAGTDGKGINVGAATSRKILVGDGSNMVLSTETYAVPWTNGNVLTSDGTNWTSAAGGGNATSNIGYLNIPQNSQSAAYTTVLTDSGKHLYHPSADTTARTWTIDSNANVAYPIGTAITFVNDTSGWVITIAITSDTLVLAGAGTTGSRTLAANGVATAIKMTSTRWIISGSGLT